jgi:polyisoprenoid-binding protein YceI
MTRTVALAAATAVLAAAPTLAHAAAYDLDAAHTKAGFRVKHMMVSNVKGSFQKLAGTVDYDEKAPEKIAIRADIDTASIITDSEQRDQHLKSPDFFDVAKFPKMTFVSKKAKALGQGHLQVTGDLTIRGITKEVVLDVEGLDVEAKDPWGNLRRGGTATTKIHRKDFGLTWNKGLETGGVLVGDDVEIALDFELIKKA